MKSCEIQVETHELAVMVSQWQKFNSNNLGEFNVACTANLVLLGQEITELQMGIKFYFGLYVNILTLYTPHLHDTLPYVCLNTFFVGKFSVTV